MAGHFRREGCGTRTSRRYHIYVALLRPCAVYATRDALTVFDRQPFQTLIAFVVAGHPATGGLHHAAMAGKLGFTSRATPEKQAERALNNLRMELFQAEQHVLDAQLRVDYYRARLTFLEEVASKAIEQVSDERKGLQEPSPALRPGLKLTAAQ